MADEISAINDAVLEQLKKRIKEKQAQDVANAQGMAASRGISGSDFEGVQIAGANKAATDAETDAMVKTALDNAQRAREDRIRAEDQAFQSSESQKGRDFSASESQKTRDFSTNERVSGQQFTAEQNKSAQEFQSKQQDLQNQYASIEAEKQRAFAAGESEKVRQFEAVQTQIQQEFTANENELNRIQQTNSQNLAAAQEEAAQRRGARYDLLNTAVGTGGNVVGQIIGGKLFGGSKAGVSTPQTSLQRNPITGAMEYVPIAGTPGAAVAPSAGSLAAGGALYAAGVAGGAYGGQVAGKSLFGQNTNGIKAGSLIGASGGNPLLGVAGGVLGGVAGKAVNAVKKIFCFAPDTLVKMRDGSEMEIKDLQLGDETLGGKVQSMRTAKVDDGSMYNYRGVWVTGYHAVKHNGIWKRVKDVEEALPVHGEYTVYSIATDLHRVHVHNIEFADEVETNHSEFLNFQQSLDVLNAGGR
jgi:hypothetical protein